MRLTSSATLAVLAGMLLAGSGAAQVSQTDVIASNAPGALDAPEAWNCNRLRPEYSQWLDAGNSPESWRFAGKTYRDSQTGNLYTWQDWLSWAEGAGCFAGYTPEGVPNSSILIGGAVTAFGASLIAVQGGSGPKSPG